MKNIIIAVIVLAIVGGGAYWYLSAKKVEVPVEEGVSGMENEGGRVATSSESGTTTTEGKLKADTFSGELEEVNTGCFVDAECYVVVDGKHVTLVRGWSQEIVGSVQGVPSIGDLESHIGEEVEVYAQDKGDGTFTLYGSEGFYVKLK